MSRLPRRVVVFGGTGFLGRVVVAQLVACGIETRIAVRHPERIRQGADLIQPFKVDIRVEASVARAIEGCEGVVNAVGLYVETEGDTFQAVHEDGARVVARHTMERAAGNLVHISGIGVDAASRSPYVRARAIGEALVIQACPTATILRPSVLFGPNDSFITSLIGLVGRSPILPLFGRGRTRLQPVFVGDVAAASVQSLRLPEARGRIYELGGPRIYRYRDLLALLCDHLKRRRLMIPVPFGVWRLIARAGTLLPHPPISEAQITLMRSDNVVGGGMPSFTDFGIEPLDLTVHLQSRDRLLHQTGRFGNG